MNLLEAGNQPLVSIITLNYNQAAVTISFLESSKRLLYTNFEILVCDMASVENAAIVIDKGEYPKTKLLLSKINLGFAGGNNWGIRQAKGEYIFIVNNDTELTPDIIEKLLLPFYEHSAIGVVCPKIKYYEFPHLIQYAGFKRMNPFTGRTFSIGDHEPDNGQYDTSGITFGAHGCAMMVKRKILKKTGMFPEKFFLYYEEWDLSARIQRAGYQIWYQSEAVIYHKESMTVGKNNPIRVYYLNRNRILYMRRNNRPIQLLTFCLFFTVFTIPKTLITYVLKGQWTEIKWFFKAIGYNLTHSGKSNV